MVRTVAFTGPIGADSVIIIGECSNARLMSGRA